MSDFSTLGVSQSLSAVLAHDGITVPTPIQAATLADSLAGKDVLGRGRTGSGKTYAFLLPLVQRLVEHPQPRRPRQPRALVLAPTRELVAQIEESLAPLEATAGLTSLSVFGGVNQNPQVRRLQAGVDIVLACPGRLLDLLQQGMVDLSRIEITVLDEADHMADMGFLPTVKRILDQTPARGQRMLFSATLDNGIDAIAKRYLHQPVIHEADSAESPVAAMDHHVLEVAAGDKFGALSDLAAAPGKTILFTRTKHGAKKLAKMLLAKGIPAVELHGNLAQNARVRNMEAFHSGRVDTLVCTDIAARGIHVDDVELVVHADPPTEHKAYLHRSGRTARAGKSGTVITMVTPDQRHEVRTLMRAAKIHPTTGRADRATLERLAPGERTFLAAADAERLAYPNKPVAADAARATAGNTTGGRNRRRSRPAQPRQGSDPWGRESGSTKPAGRGARGGSGQKPATGRGTTAAGSSRGAAGFSAGLRRGR